MVKAQKRLETASAENGWINTVDADKPEVLERAYQIIKSNIYCSISTCSIWTAHEVDLIVFSTEDPG